MNRDQIAEFHHQQRHDLYYHECEMAICKEAIARLGPNDEARPFKIFTETDDYFQTIEEIALEEEEMEL